MNKYLPKTETTADITDTLIKLSAKDTYQYYLGIYKCELQRDGELALKELHTELLNNFVSRHMEKHLIKALENVYRTAYSIQKVGK